MVCELSVVVFILYFGICLCINGSIPLYYEMGCEMAYPAHEAVVGVFLQILQLTVIGIYLLLLLNDSLDTSKYNFSVYLEESMQGIKSCLNSSNLFCILHLFWRQSVTKNMFNFLAYWRVLETFLTFPTRNVYWCWFTPLGYRNIYF